MERENYNALRSAMEAVGQKHRLRAQGAATAAGAKALPQREYLTDVRATSLDRTTMGAAAKEHWHNVGRGLFGEDLNERKEREAAKQVTTRSHEIAALYDRLDLPQPVVDVLDKLLEGNQKLDVLRHMLSEMDNSDEGVFEGQQFAPDRQQKAAKAFPGLFKKGQR